MWRVQSIVPVGVTAAGEGWAVLGFEAPTQIDLGMPRLSKEDLEQVHLEKYQRDAAAATGVTPFQNVKRGTNPPDFVVTTPSGEEGIECAAFALRKRRDGFALFDRFRARLLQAARSEPFPHLADCTVTVRFGDGTDLPPKAQDQITVERFIEVLRQARVDRAAVAGASAQFSGSEPPPRLPEGLFRTFSVGKAGEVQADPVAPNSLHGEFARETGFDVHLNMSLPVTRSEVQAEFERILRKHDHPGVDRLLISLSAPDRAGLAFPNESLVVDQLPPNPVTTDHIRIVTIHNYLTGEVRDVI
jgi:hypothetical protein